MAEVLIFTVLMLILPAVLWIAPKTRRNNGNWLISLKTVPLGIVVCYWCGELMSKIAWIISDRQERDYEPPILLFLAVSLIAAFLVIIPGGLFIKRKFGTEKKYNPFLSILLFVLALPPAILAATLISCAGDLMQSDYEGEWGSIWLPREGNTGIAFQEQSIHPFLSEYNFLNSQDITHLPFYQRSRLHIGYLPQENSVFRGLSVEDNIMAVLEIVEPNRKKRQEKLDALLDEFSIAFLRKSPATSLSGGERRRVEIARALANDPKFILLDEPFAGIDPIAVNEIREMVSQLKNRGLGVIITDHNVRETLGITDRSYVLHDGMILKHGTSKEIVQDEMVKKVYLGENFTM